MRMLAAASFGLLFLLPAIIARAAPPAAQPACLRQDMVRGWTVVDDRTLIVTDRVGKKFNVSLRPGCRDLKFNLRLAFKAFGGTGLSCLGRNDYVLVPPGGGDTGQRCFITEIQAYTGAPGNAAAPAK